MPLLYRPRWSQLLAEAVARPGLILEAYSWFHKYSIANQVAALVQCREHGIEPGPIASFSRWLELGRHVRRGERGISLCMPVTILAKHDPEDTGQATTFYLKKLFVWKPHWFALSQTEGDDYKPEPCPGWEKDRALAALAVEQVPFTDLDGNAQGYAIKNKIAISPLATLPWKTLFHELGHVLLGHTQQGGTSDGERLPKNLREAEAEAVALICCDSLNLSGAEFCRGYIQEWLGAGNPIPEQSAARIFKAADSVLKAGSPPVTQNE